MKGGGHGSNATESATELIKSNKVYYCPEYAFIGFISLGQFPGTWLKWLFLVVFPSSACFADKYICGVCQTAIWETEP